MQPPELKSGDWENQSTRFSILFFGAQLPSDTKSLNHLAIQPK
jgi:hypothetical protein